MDVIAHRGASGYRPEHTRAAYLLAVEQGADYLEPDLVSTADHMLVVRHENEISGTTDVAGHPEFIDRRTTREVDGIPVDGWFTEDFTLAELKTLRTVERLPELRPGSAAYDRQGEVLTFAEVVELARVASERTGRTIGVAPETKHPSHFAALGLPLEEPLLGLLNELGWTRPDAPIIVQSFEVNNLRRLNEATGVRLLQLVGAAGAPHDLRRAGDPRTFDELSTPRGLAEIAEYAEFLAPVKERILPRITGDRLGEPTRLVDDAHAAGLEVVAWSFRAENDFLPVEYRCGEDPAALGDGAGEIARFLRLGVDHVFSDFPDVAVQAREQVRAGS